MLDISVTIIDTFIGNSMCHYLSITEADGKQIVEQFVNVYDALERTIDVCRAYKRDYEILSKYNYSNDTKTLYEHAYPVVIAVDCDFYKVQFELVETENEK